MVIIYRQGGWLGYGDDFSAAARTAGIDATLAGRLERAAVDVGDGRREGSVWTRHARFGVVIDPSQTVPPLY